VLELPTAGSAILSPCGKYRYLLTREMGPEEKVATFIMLNPSTADATTDDQTIRKCIGLAKKWRCGKLDVVNLFALRSTDPKALRQADDPIGPENMRWIACALKISKGPIVCAWGTHGAYLDQDLAVLELLDHWKISRLALGVTKDGHPRHPLYVPYAAPLLPFKRRTAR